MRVSAGLKWHAVLQTNKGASTEMKPQVVFRGYHLMELFPHWLQVQGRDKDSQSPETQTANVALRAAQKCARGRSDPFLVTGSCLMNYKAP